MDFFMLVPWALNSTKWTHNHISHSNSSSFLLFSVMVFSQSYRNEILALFFLLTPYLKEINLVMSYQFFLKLSPISFLPHLSALYPNLPNIWLYCLSALSGFKHFHKSHTWKQVHYLHNPPPSIFPHLLSPHLVFS